MQYYFKNLVDMPTMPMMQSKHPPGSSTWGVIRSCDDMIRGRGLTPCVFGDPVDWYYLHPRIKDRSYDPENRK